MARRLVILFLLLTVFINLRPIKPMLFRFLNNSIYYPFVYSRNLLILLQNTERNSANILLENTSLREKIFLNQINTISQDKASEKTLICEVLEFTPLGIPKELIVRMDSNSKAQLQNNTVIDQKGALVGLTYKQTQDLVFIKTIYNEELRIAVESINPYYTGILKGGITPEILYIPFDAPIKAGDTLYTSSLSSIITPYIPVGVIAKFEKDMENPIFLKASIKPFFVPFTSRKLVIFYGK